MPLWLANVPYKSETQPHLAGFTASISRFLAVSFCAFGSKGCGGGRRDIAVDHVLQFLAGLEEGNLLGRNLDAVASLGIASDAWFALPGAEAAKAANFNLVTRAQGAHHALKDSLDNDLAVLAGQLRQAGNFVDQICLGHYCSPLCGRFNRLTGILSNFV